MSASEPLPVLTDKQKKHIEELVHESCDNAVDNGYGGDQMNNPVAEVVSDILDYDAATFEYATDCQCAHGEFGFRSNAHEQIYRKAISEAVVSWRGGKIVADSTSHTWD